MRRLIWSMGFFAQSVSHRCPRLEGKVPVIPKGTHADTEWNACIFHFLGNCKGVSRIISFGHHHDHVFPFLIPGLVESFHQVETLAEKAVEGGPMLEGAIEVSETETFGFEDKVSDGKRQRSRL